MAGQHSHPLAFQGIPNVAGPVVVSTKEYTTRNRESNRRDAAQNVVVGEGVEFTVRADVEQPARSVVGASGESVAIGEEPEYRTNQTTQHRKSGLLTRQR